MTLDQLLEPGSVRIDLRVSDKRRLLEVLSAWAAPAARADAGTVFEALLRREALGSTGMGRGTAIPHARLVEVRRPLAFVSRLEAAVDYDAIDGEPVDFVCLLLLPTVGPGSEPLSALAGVARRFRSPVLLAELRQARDAAGLHALLTREPPAS